MGGEQDVIIFSTDDCPPVDDLIHVKQDNDLEIPKNLLPTSEHGDQFFISMEVEALFHPEVEDENEDEEFSWWNFESWDARSVSLNFLTPCKRVRRGNLPAKEIVRMLSKAGVPACKREYMVERIAKVADEMAAAAKNQEMKVLPMFVRLDLIACPCMDVKAWA